MAIRVVPVRETLVSVDIPHPPGPSPQPVVLKPSAFPELSCPKPRARSYADESFTGGWHCRSQITAGPAHEP
jgi:hypothetical protein